VIGWRGEGGGGGTESTVILGSRGHSAGPGLVTSPQDATGPGLVTSPQNDTARRARPASHYTAAATTLYTGGTRQPRGAYRGSGVALARVRGRGSWGEAGAYHSMVGRPAGDRLLSEDAPVLYCSAALCYNTVQHYY